MPDFGWYPWNTVETSLYSLWVFNWMGRPRVIKTSGKKQWCGPGRKSTREKSSLQKVRIACLFSIYLAKGALNLGNREERHLGASCEWSREIQSHRARRKAGSKSDLQGQRLSWKSLAWTQSAVEFQWGSDRAGLHLHLIFKTIMLITMESVSVVGGEKDKRMDLGKENNSVWLEVKNRSETDKDKYHIILLMCGL